MTHKLFHFKATLDGEEQSVEATCDFSARKKAEKLFTFDEDKKQKQFLKIIQQGEV